MAGPLSGLSSAKSPKPGTREIAEAGRDRKHGKAMDAAGGWPAVRPRNWARIFDIAMRIGFRKYAPVHQDETGAETPLTIDSETLLRVRDLETVFATRDARIFAVNRVSFDLAPGEVLGVVGESGSGKSVTMMSLIGLLPSPAGKDSERKRQVRRTRASRDGKFGASEDPGR